MTTLRCTAKVLALVGAGTGALDESPPTEDDWYVNLLWIERRKCLLLTHASTLFPIVVLDVRKPTITPFGPFVVDLIDRHVADEQLSRAALGQLDRESVRLAKTASRNILGVMNDSARQLRYRIDAMGGIDRADERILSRYLRRTLHCRDGRYATPLELVAERLRLG